MLLRFARRFIPVLLLCAPGLRAQTNISIPAATGAGVKYVMPTRFGINLDDSYNYGNNQLTANLLASDAWNFAPQTWQQSSNCAYTTNSNIWVDSNGYSPQIGNFWFGATYQIVSGPDAGESGYITASSAGNIGPAGVQYTLSNPLAADCVHSEPGGNPDQMIVRCTTALYTCATGYTAADMPGMTVGSSGGGTVAFEHTDLSPSSVAVQGLQLNAPGVAQAGVTANFDGILQSKAFINLNGTYTLTFRAKATSGNPILGYTVYRVGNTPFLSGTVNPTVNVSPGYGWTNYSYSFTASETGSQNSTGQVWLNATGGTVLLQDMALTEAPTGGNPTVFRNAVYQKLLALHPGMLRDMTTYSWGCSSENMMLAAASARVNCGFNSYLNIGQPISYGWSDFLQLSHAVGATAAWITISAFTTPTQMDEIAAYLSGTCGNGNAWTTQRCNYGQTTPWTSLFPGGIYLELGNEIWNSPNGENLYGNGGQNYGQLAAANVAALKASSYYASNIKFVASGFILASDYEYGWNQTVLAAMGSHLPDYIDGAPYMYYDMTDLSSLANIFGPMFAEPYNFVSPTYGAGTGYTYGLQSFTATNYPGVNGAVYETNLATTCALTGTTQTQINQVVGGLGAGLDATLTMLLAARDAGVLVQNFFAFPEDVNQFGLSTSTASGSCSLLNTYTPYQPLWGSNLFMPGPTNAQSIDRPSGIALQLVNNAMGSNLNLLNTVQTGTPTYNQPAAQPNPTSWPTPGLDSISANSAVPYVSAFGFGDGAGNYSLIVYNTNLTGSEAITFSGPGAPTGTVTKTVFTSGNITDNNEGLSIGSTPVVTYPTSTTISNPTGDTLPAVSVTTYTWTSGGSSGPSIAVGSSLSPSTYGQSVTFTATLTGTSTAPTGSVTFLNGGTAIGTANLTVTGALTSTATFTTSTLPGGTDAITVSYASASSPAFNQVVNSGSVTAAVTSSLNPSVYGQSTTLTATVSGASAAPTGSVVFMNGATSLGSATLTPGSGLSSTATFATSTLPVGTDSLTAVYAATANFGAATSPALSQVVSAASTTTTVASSLTPSSYGQSVNLTATVTAALASQVSVALTPGTVTLTPSQTQMFTASVAGTSNTAVTWSLNPAVGGISAGGLYTAPASISSAQTITVTATSVADSTKTASATVSLAPLAATYYMSPVGSDSNPGTSASPWASPNHALNCGDTITAAAGAYNVNSFHFGVVTCSAGNNVAWLQCATAFACTGSVTSGGQYSQGIGIGESYWGVQGWVVHTGVGESDCFAVAPNSPSISISHIIFANDIANGCGKAGFEATTNGSAGVDYFAVVGSIVYGAAAGSTLCESGINSFSPVATDTLPGTHYYYAGNLSFDNVNPIPCNGSSPSTDGEGLFFDTMGTYNQQMVMDNNLAAFNGGNGIKSYNSTSGANIYFRHNTAVADETGGVNGAICSEIGLQSSLNGQAYLNLGVTGASTGCSGPSAIYVLAASSANSTVSFTNNYGYSAAGNDSLAGGATLSGNTFANPILSNPVNPSPPSCGSFSTTTACMATVIANFAPTNAAAVGYGYQPPSNSPVYDPLFPLWLCNINLPSGLVTMGCLTTPSGTYAAPTGSVTFMNGATSIGSVTLTAGSGLSSSATLTTSTLPVGTDSITAVYAGTANNGGSTSSALSQTVNAASTTAAITSSLSPSGSGQSITLTATISSGYAAPTGSVTFMNGATSIGSATLTPGSGLSSTATLATSTLPIGTDSLTVVYAATTNFGAATSTALSQIVSAASSTAAVASSLNPASAGQSVTFTATLTSSTAAPTGSVTFMNGATSLGSATLTAGGGVSSTATLSTSALPVGTDSITVVYAGTANFGAATSPALSQVINGANTTATIASSLNPANSGQTVTFTATVSSGSAAPTGSVTFMNGATSLGSATLTPGGGVSSTATFSTAALPAGTDPITVVYAATGSFGASTSSALNQVVNGASTTATVASSLNPANSGQAVTFTATISSGSAAPTGSVTFMNGATSLGSATLTPGSGTSSTATLATAALPVGTDSITAVYAATVNFAASTSAVLSQVINGGSTAATVTSSVSPASYAQSVTFTATVSSGGGAAPTGSVTFMNGATTMGSVTLTPGSGGNSTAAFTSAALPVGTDAITAVYAGNGSFGAATSAAFNQVINPAFINSAMLASSQNPSSQNQPVTFTATFSTLFVAPTGSLAFTDGTTTLGTATLTPGSGLSSTASLTTSTLPMGTRSITAVYAATTDFGPVSSNTISQVVNAAASTTATVTSSVNPAGTGQSVTLTGTIVGVTTAPTGSVVFMDGATAIGTVTLTTAGGVTSTATLTTSTLPIGTDPITVVYAGNGSNGAATSAVFNQVVNPPASTATVASSVNPASVGQAVTFTATITSSGSAAPTGSVTLMSGTTSLGSATLTPGGGVSSTATLTTTSLPAGTDSITAVYAGTANFGAATSPALSEVISAASTTAAVASSVSPSSYGQTVTFTATVSSSNAAPTGSVVFLVGATPLGSATLAAGGGASSTATLSVNSLAVGTNSITVVYAATQNFAASTSSAISQVVNAASTTATVASSANPAGSGQAVVLTATISSGYAAPAGPVVFLNGATPIGSATLVSASGASSTASISTSTLPMGTDPITVVYAATTTFGASTSTALSQVINNAVSSATLTSSQNPASLGQTVTLTASINSNSVVAGPPSGAVTFMDGPAVLAASQPLAVSGATTSAVSFSVSTLAVGSHSITATYVPTGNFTASTASLTQVVSGLGSATVLTASPNPSPAGQTVTLTAVVSGGSSTPSGTVTFYNGATAIGSGTLDSNGHTSITTAGLAAGADTLTAVYSGSPVYSGSTSAAVTETIQATPQDFSVALASPSLTVPTQSSQTTTVTLTSENGFADTLSLSCSNLPTYVTCSVSPAASTLTANGTATTTLTIGTVSNFAYSPSDSGPLHPSDSPLNLALMLSPMGLLAGIAAFPKRRSRRLPRLYLFVLLLAAIPMALAFNGCATPSIIHELSSAAAGTYTIPVKATGANTGTNHTVQLTLTVTP